MMPRVLFVCGTYNQTTQMLQIAASLPECEAVFSPHFADGVLGAVQPLGFIDFTTPGRPWVKRTTEYLRRQGAAIDYRAAHGPYDLVVLSTDLIVPAIARRTPSILVQEGMTDPETWLFDLVRRIRIVPRWIASSAAFGLSDVYEAMCVASEGYRDLFIRKGVRPDKIRVTGIPNFDDCERYTRNELARRQYVLVCTSDVRENFRYENRRVFIERAVRIAAGRPLVFKLHPNERAERAQREIERYAPGADVLTSGSAEELIANCDVLITKWSSVAFVGLALGKEVHSDFAIDDLRRLLPLQNKRAAALVADICREVLTRHGKLVPRSRRTEAAA